MTTVPRCPHCGQVFTLTERTAADDQPAMPEAGDVTVCWGCAGVGMFTADGGVRLPEPAELAELRADPAVHAELTRVAAVIRLHGGGRR